LHRVRLLYALKGSGSRQSPAILFVRQKEERFAMQREERGAIAELIPLANCRYKHSARIKRHRTNRFDEQVWPGQPG